MKITLRLGKMKTYQHLPVKYTLSTDGEELDLNARIGQQLKLTFTGKIYCQNCGRVSKKSYNQGFCFPCSLKLAQCDLCILKPETCHYHLGTCREPSWGEEHCMGPHIVYLANSSGPKVGITRKTQLPQRWMDQGATQALAVLEVPKRLTAGLIEVLFKRHIGDKTDWRKMLKGPAEEINLVDLKEKLLTQLQEELRAHEHVILEETECTFQYPVLQYPQKVSSLSLEKVSEINSRLIGIKGQYLIFESGVFNVRAHSGHELMIEE
jgi:hypothetical protein